MRSEERCATIKRNVTLPGCGRHAVGADMMEDEDGGHEDDWGCGKREHGWWDW